MNLSEIRDIKKDIDAIIEEINQTNPNKILTSSIEKVKDKILNLIELDGRIPVYNNYFDNDFSGRLISFYQLNRALIDLKERVETLANSVVSHQVVRSYTSSLSSLVTLKMKILKIELLKRGRLPVNYFQFLQKKQENSRQILNLKHNKPNFSYLMVEIETFHSVLAHEDNVKEIDLEELEGNLTSYSLISLEEILKNNLANERDENKIRIKQILLNELGFAITIAQKLELVDNIKLIRKKEFKLSLIYYENLAHATSALSHFIEAKQYLKEIKSYQSDSQVLESICLQDRQTIRDFIEHTSCYTSVPRSILIQDISWDLVTKFKNLKPEEYMFLPLGTRTHSIFVELRAEKLSSEKMTYSCQIFNMDNEILKWHSIKKEDQSNWFYVKPLTIKRIEKQAFPYEFFRKLAQCTLKAEETKDFYCVIEDYLIKKGNGKVYKELGHWHLLPKRGTCSFSTAEMGIFEHLDQLDIKKVRLTKTIRAVYKQGKIIQKQKEQLGISKEWVYKKIPFKSQVIKKLRQSIKLLEYSRHQFYKNLAEFKRVKDS